MGDVIQMPLAAPADVRHSETMTTITENVLPRHADDYPFLARDAYGDEALAPDMASVLHAAHQLQRDAAERLCSQGSGQQTVVIYQRDGDEWAHRLTIDRRIRQDELPR